MENSRGIRIFAFDKSNVTASLSVLIGLVIYLAIMVVISGISTANITNTIMSETEAHAIIEIPNEILHRGVHKDVADSLSKLEYIRHIKIINDSDLINALSTFVANDESNGNIELIAKMPLPLLIEVYLRDDCDIGQLYQMLKNIDENIQIYDNTNWKQGRKVALSVNNTSVWLTIIIFMILAAISVFASYSMLISRKDTVNIMQLVGAKSSTIADIFVKESFYIMTRAFIIGTLFSASTISVMHFVLSYNLDLIIVAAVIIVMPVFIIIFISQVAKFTVLLSVGSWFEDKWYHYK